MFHQQIELIILMILLRISYTDLQEHRIGKMEVTALCLITVINNVILANTSFLTDFINALFGGLVCGGIAEFVNMIFFDLKGFGGGDIRFMFAAGWLLGAENGLLALLFGGITVLILSGLYGLYGKKNMLKAKVPFGPFLTFGIICIRWIIPYL